MRFAAFSLAVGLAALQPAAAQSVAPVGFMPMPTTMPTLLFAPDPLAGTMLAPLTEPLEAAATVVAAAQTVPPPDSDPAPAAEAAPPAAVVAEEPVAVVPPAQDEPAATSSVTVPEPAAPPAPPAPTLGVVHVIVENVEAATGSVNVALCDKGLSREGCPYVREVNAQQGFVQAEFDDIPPGTYAVVGYHDVNGNSEFDKLMGIPREPYALSARAAEKMVPSFSDAALAINAGENSVIIRLKRLGG